MINFREIFNTSYGYMGYVVILILFGLIILINRDLRDSLRITGTIIIVSSVMDLLIGFISKLFINILIPGNYKIFIEVISDTLYSSLLYKGIIGLILGTMLLVVYRFVPIKKKV